LILSCVTGAVAHSNALGFEGNSKVITALARYIHSGSTKLFEAAMICERHEKGPPVLTIHTVCKAAHALLEQGDPIAMGTSAADLIRAGAAHCTADYAKLMQEQGGLPAPYYTFTLGKAAYEKGKV
jgi:hypothetical protein